MTTGPLQDPTADLFSLPDTAARLDVPETTVREWLATFNWERRYDGDGHLYLTRKDLEFLRVIKSLKDVDRSCESIVRILEQDDDLPPVETLTFDSKAPGSAAEGLIAEAAEAAEALEAQETVEEPVAIAEVEAVVAEPEPTEAAPDEAPQTLESVIPEDNGLAQIETLKAELRELHAAPAPKKPFWKFW